jgi:rubrerythrin
MNNNNLANIYPQHQHQQQQQQQQQPQSQMLHVPQLQSQQQNNSISVMQHHMQPPIPQAPLHSTVQMPMQMQPQAQLFSINPINQLSATYMNTLDTGAAMTFMRNNGNSNSNNTMAKSIVTGNSGITDSVNGSIALESLNTFITNTNIAGQNRHFSTSQMQQPLMQQQQQQQQQQSNHLTSINPSYLLNKPLSSGSHLQTFNLNVNGTNSNQSTKNVAQSHSPRSSGISKKKQASPKPKSKKPASNTVSANLKGLTNMNDASVASAALNTANSIDSTIDNIINNILNGESNSTTTPVTTTTTATTTNTTNNKNNNNNNQNLKSGNKSANSSVASLLPSVNSQPQFKCNTCGKEFLKSDFLKKHILSKHTVTPLYSCSFCKQGFSTKSTARSHVENGHADYVCPVCNKTFKSGSLAKRHIESLHANIQQQQQQSDQQPLKPRKEIRVECRLIDMTAENKNKLDLISLDGYSEQQTIASVTIGHNANGPVQNINTTSNMIFANGQTTNENLQSTTTLIPSTTTHSTFSILGETISLSNPNQSTFNTIGFAAANGTSLTGGLMNQPASGGLFFINQPTRYTISNSNELQTTTTTAASSDHSMRKIFQSAITPDYILDMNNNYVNTAQLITNGSKSHMLLNQHANNATSNIDDLLSIN